MICNLLGVYDKVPSVIFNICYQEISSTLLGVIITVSRSEATGTTPKLFFVSSSSTTTTILTSTFCYATISPAPFPITTCNRKRRRFIITDGKSSSANNIYVLIL